MRIGPAGLKENGGIKGRSASGSVAECCANAGSAVTKRRGKRIPEFILPFIKTIVERTRHASHHAFDLAAKASCAAAFSAAITSRYGIGP